jgi:hypothetical protein
LYVSNDLNDDKESNSDSDSNSDSNSDSETEMENASKHNSIKPVPNEFSIINIMTTAYNKQQEAMSHNIVHETSAFFNDYSKTIITVDNIKYLLIKPSPANAYSLRSYLTYKLSNDVMTYDTFLINNINNYNQTTKKCYYCQKKLKWSVSNKKWVNVHCKICDKIVINFTTKMVYNDTIFTADKINWPKKLNFNTKLHTDPDYFVNRDHSFYTTGFDFRISDYLAVRVEKKKEEIYLNDNLEFIYWLYVGDNSFIYIRGDYFNHVFNDKYTSPFKEIPTIKYNNQILPVNMENTYGNVFYKCTINGIFLIC